MGRRRLRLSNVHVRPLVWLTNNRKADRCDISQHASIQDESRSASMSTLADDGKIAGQTVELTTEPEDQRQQMSHGEGLEALFVP